MLSFFWSVILILKLTYVCPLCLPWVWSFYFILFLSFWFLCKFIESLESQFRDYLMPYALCLMPYDLMNCVCRLWVGFVSSETLIWSFECLLSYSTFTYINPPSNRPSTFSVSANFLLERICLLMLLLLFDVQSNWCLSIDKPVQSKAK